MNQLLKNMSFKKADVDRYMSSFFDNQLKIKFKTNPIKGSLPNRWFSFAEDPETPGLISQFTNYMVNPRQDFTFTVKDNILVSVKLKSEPIK